MRSTVQVATILILVLFATSLTATDAGASSCQPRSADEWSARSLSHGGEIESHLSDVRRFPALRHLDSLSAARELLATARFGGDCRRALRELLAAALNLATDRLNGECCLDRPAFRQALQRAADDCHAQRNCPDALRVLRRLNDRGAVADCDSSDDDSSDDDSSDDDSSDDDSSDDHSSDDDSSDDDSSDDHSSDDLSSDDSAGLRPRSRGWWQGQCLGTESLDARGGRGRSAHPHLSASDRDRAIRGATRSLARVDLRPCAALDPRRLGTERGRAEAEVAALALNEAAGFLVGCERGTEALRSSVRLLGQREWRQARELAHDLNQGRCDDGTGQARGDSRREDRGRAGDDRGRAGDDRGRGGDDDRGGSRGKGRGKGRGKSR